MTDGWLRHHEEDTWIVAPEMPYLTLEIYDFHCKGQQGVKQGKAWRYMKFEGGFNPFHQCWVLRHGEPCFDHKYRASFFRRVILVQLAPFVKLGEPCHDRLVKLGDPWVQNVPRKFPGSNRDVPQKDWALEIAEIAEKLLQNGPRNHLVPQEDVVPQNGLGLLKFKRMLRLRLNNFRMMLCLRRNPQVEREDVECYEAQNRLQDVPKEIVHLSEARIVELEREECACSECACSEIGSCEAATQDAGPQDAGPQDADAWPEDESEDESDYAWL